MPTISTTQNYPTIQNEPSTATSNYDHSAAANYGAAAGTTASHVSEAAGTSGGQDTSAATTQAGQLFQSMSFFDDPDMSSFDLFDTGRDFF